MQIKSFCGQYYAPMCTINVRSAIADRNYSKFWISAWFWRFTNAIKSETYRYTIIECFSIEQIVIILIIIFISTNLLWPLLYFGRLFTHKRWVELKYMCFRPDWSRALNFNWNRTQSKEFLYVAVFLYYRDVKNENFNVFNNLARRL